MSIRNIDTQIMITRQMDFSKDTSNIQRHPETTQEHIAAQTKVESAQEQSRVHSTTETENEEIRTDVDAEGQGAEGGGSGSQKEEEMTEEQKKELLVAPAAHEQLIDIMW